VRWVPSKNCGACELVRFNITSIYLSLFVIYILLHRRQADAWNDMLKKYKDHDYISFGEIDLSQESLREGHNVGIGGWPTLRYFNSNTGIAGESYQKKTNMKMAEELSDKEILESFLLDKSTSLLCKIDLMDKCDEKEQNYITLWNTKSRKEIIDQIERLQQLRKSSNIKPDVVQWVIKRINILNQIIKRSTSNNEL
jgi:hypothetical protein